VIRFLAATLAGAVFGTGMAISGMTDPARVLGFFDVTGAWDPTLAFVMAGALLPMVFAWRLRAKMQKSVLGADLPGPASKTIDAKLIGGAAVFGVGWGIAGICPGAVIPALAYGGWPVAVFLIAMLAGMFLQGRLATMGGTPATA
jgi:uncharacterized membrane protein YedE/YeeE